MPMVFDSHEQFNEWFSKGIENRAEHGSTLNEHQLNRLGTEIQLGLAVNSKNPTLAVKRRLACEQEDLITLYSKHIFYILLRYF
ncbi:hypothetical protein HA466_0217900 [Hirschfeldia incana]|nr:hypothetical protein HA466_0217900 [Hirschfeldia incana]KAJ0241382.1 hypothetical protein HA466_0217900 [Hirschfeldia incana]KAJ0241383.1 hypothetical protein HA466_0217900 [Hirschfeldia incana]KAJ0241384.1 hypothetical protein HA466_0217900 [Hirschfeldia incana]